MRLGTDYLTTGQFEPAWTEPFEGGALDGLKLKIGFAGVSERRKALLDDEGNPKPDADVRAFYLSKVVGWNVEDSEFSAEALNRLLDLEARLEGFIVSEVNSAARFLGRSGDAPAEAPQGD